VKHRLSAHRSSCQQLQKKKSSDKIIERNKIILKNQQYKEMLASIDEEKLLQPTKDKRKIDKEINKKHEWKSK
jgi:uncharacterized protein (DUF1778 family)